MPRLVQVAIACAAVVLAATIAFGVPAVMPGADPMPAQLGGAIALLAGLLLNEALARRGEQRALARELEGHRSQQSKVLGELGRSRAELHQLHDALEAALRKRTSGASRELDQVMREVNVLKRLVNEIADTPAVRALPRAGEPARLDGHASGHALSAEGEGSDRDPARIEGEAAADLDDDEILEAVREGLAADRVDLYLQPIVSLPQRRRRYFECYSRIRTAYGAVLMPGQYLPVAAKAGLLSAIDNLLLLRCVQLVRKSQQRRFDVGFFVHVSAHTLGDTTFLDEFVDFLLENEDLAPHLFFEFAEKDAVGRAPAVAKALQRLGVAGFRFSLDTVEGLALDPAALKAMHVGFVKIGADVALSGEGGAAGFADVKNQLERAGIEVIVEKIESEPVLLELLDHHVDFGQGFLFGAPRLSRDT
jgi:cyclic-di-GMP phosphodiesterase TipF (flagellum assembly factor)